ncbi:aspartyl/asparaginyl beta-hydroxylase domain-containing protein [Dokdonella ginsengisoli]|uniref:Aspartyl/asparaginyl beta-hydroxylase domain-containing protein n=1 Tax=Dokdonella ginsengisoli TaxID=363846 RepID=A0ABV9QQ27_9GAMM
MPELSFRLVLLLLFAIYLACVLYVHLRGRQRLKFGRQLVDHSGLFAPYNVLMYAFSAVPARPILDRARFPHLDLLRDNWQRIRAEALHLFDEGYIRSAEKHNDASFASFFKEGWKRFYLKWYGEPLASAHALCPETVALLEKMPSVKAAMFALLPPGSKLNPHRDPFAGSLRYHLGLVTPNSDDCRIFVDGELYSWRDGGDIVFDETYVHWAENRTQETRVILFCDVERPLRTAPMRAVNRFVSRVLGQATATQNVGGERVGTVNRLYALAHRAGELRKAFKRRTPLGYRLTRIVLIACVVGWLVLPWIPLRA